MTPYEDYKDLIEEFSTEVLEWTKSNSLSTLPEYNQLQNKVILGQCFRHDQLYFEQLADYKATYFGLASFLTKQLSITTDREIKRNIEALIDSVTTKIKELDTRLEAGKKRLDFYKTIVYMIGNIIYGAD